MALIGRLPPLNSLRALEAIQLTGSVTAAARSLGVSHSAVSHQMKILEDWAQQPVFARKGRSVVLTVAGESLALVTHQAFDSIRHEMDRMPTRDMRRVSISALPIIALRWLAPRYQNYSALENSVRLHISIAQSDRPMTPQPDIEILFGPRNRLQAQDRPFLSGDAIPACSPSLLERYGGNPRKLLETGPLIHDEDLRMWPKWFEGSAYQRQHETEHTLLVIDDSELLRAFTLRGGGVGLCRTALVQEDLNAGRLVTLSEQSIDGDHCYFLRFDPSKSTEPNLARVLQWLESEVGTDQVVAFS